MSSWLQLDLNRVISQLQVNKNSSLHFGPIFAMVCPDIGIILPRYSKNI